jgi:3-deoxy-D-manno-octulosonic acid (KDO) 8-phosphate synthase
MALIILKETRICLIFLVHIVYVCGSLGDVFIGRREYPQKLSQSSLALPIRP